MNAPNPWREARWLAALLALLVVVGLFRPLLPIDETRYASVAWEMWARGDFLVPFRNGVPYHHKPPLLFWLMQAGWALFGVNEWWPRLISPLFAAGTLWLSFRLGRRLWPQRPDVALMAPYILLASLLYTYFASALMFDTMLAFFVALGLYGLVLAAQTGAGRGGFALFTLGLGGALYAKGPVALLHLMPAALLAPWWLRESPPRWRRWYAGVLLALLGGALLILAWAIPAGFAGGEEYRNAIFWGQTAGRMTKSFAHRAPGWYYFAYLPLMLAPWLLWPRWWHGLKRGIGAESGVRLCALVMLLCLAAFTLISGKRWHYLLPEFVPFALLAARALSGSEGRRWSLTVPALTIGLLGVAAVVGAPRLSQSLGGLDDARALYAGGALSIAVAAALLGWRPGAALADVRVVAVAMLVAFAALLASADVAMREPYDVGVVAERIAQYQREDRPVAVEGEYHGQWHLAGRLREPLTELATKDVPQWLAEHPRGRVIYLYERDEALPGHSRIDMPPRRYRGQMLVILAPR